MSSTHNSPVELSYLSPEFVDFIKHNRQKNATWFGFAEDLNRTCQAILTSHRIENGEVVLQHLVAILFLIRTLSNFQGVIIMAERGMAVEAQTLARCCYENAFCLAALLKDGDRFLADLQSDEDMAVKQKAKWILKGPTRLDESGPDVAKNLEASVRSSRPTIEGFRDPRTSLKPD